MARKDSGKDAGCSSRAMPAWVNRRSFHSQNGMLVMTSLRGHMPVLIGRMSRSVP